MVHLLTSRLFLFIFFLLSMSNVRVSHFSSVWFVLFVFHLVFFKDFFFSIFNNNSSNSSNRSDRVVTLSPFVCQY